LSQDRLGSIVYVSGDTIAKIEKALRWPQPELTQRCDEALGANGALARLTELLEVDRSRGAHEDTTGVLQAGDSGQPDHRRLLDAVKVAGAAWFGMLPEPAVATAGLSRDPLGIPTRVERAQVEGLHHSIGVFEQWDHRYGGGLALSAMRGQIDWACRVAKKSSMTDDVRRSWQSAAARLGDLAGWACFDAGEDEAAQEYFIVALQLAGEAGDIQQRVHTATSLSRQLTYLGRVSDALAMADLARLGWRSLPSLGRAVIGIVEARAYGRAADAESCRRAVGLCDEQFEKNEVPTEDETWGYYADEGQILGDAGHALFDLAMTTGDVREATSTVSRLTAAYATHPPESTRSKALTMLRVACLNARYGDPIEACYAAELAVDDAHEVTSRRIADDLRLLERTLSGLPGTAASDSRVEQVRDRIKSMVGSPTDQ
jgi:hypothetical protein